MFGKIKVVSHNGGRGEDGTAGEDVEAWPVHRGRDQGGEETEDDQEERQRGLYCRTFDEKRTERQNERTETL